MQQRVIITFVLLLATASACRTEHRPTVVLQGSSGAVPVAVEVASTPDEVTRGLMYRKSLADGDGMLFVFAGDEVDHSFWMKNTLIPLDMLFIAREGPGGRVVGIHENATPLSLSPISVGKPSAFVLEVPGGWTRRVGIKTGDAVTLPPLPSP
ncbi:MAG TPA: DUF192 domain-containing protein [Candidatus Binatia bacterium]|jgi:uncharacterized membrane protein (UPF0127 family)|nr:DUF192 domain-containing protein [Candidatus Binatia bacterium]